MIFGNFTVHGHITLPLFWGVTPMREVQAELRTEQFKNYHREIIDSVFYEFIENNIGISINFNVIFCKPQGGI